MPAHYLRIFFFCCVIAACKSSGTIHHVDTQQYSFSKAATASADSSLYYYVQPFRTKLDAEMNEVLAYADEALEKNRPEGKLGNFVADACIAQAALKYASAGNKQIDFCFLNNGGLRNALPAGAISMRHVFELMPFENELVVLTVDSSVLIPLFDFMASKDGVPVSNLKLKMKDKKAVDIFIDGQPFDKSKIYKLITSDYLANGGDNLGFLAAVQQREYIGLKVRDAVIKQLEKINSEGKTVKGSIEGRITYAE